MKTQIRSKQLRVQTQVRAGSIDPQKQLEQCQSKLGVCKHTGKSENACLNQIQDCQNWIDGCVTAGYDRDWCAEEALGKHAYVGPFG